MFLPLRDIFHGYIFILSIGIFLSGCYNNSHLRTQRILEEGDKATSVNADINIPILSLIPRSSSIAGWRVELSSLKGQNNGEFGPYAGFGLGFEPDPAMTGFFGLEYKKYIAVGSSEHPWKLGFQGEINNFVREENEPAVLQLRPSLTTTTSDYRNKYWGVHGLFSDYLASLGSSGYRGNIIGAGLTYGFENNDFQVQVDASLVKGKLPKKRSGRKYWIGTVVGIAVGKNFIKSPALSNISSGPSPEPGLIEQSSEENISESKTNNDPVDRHNVVEDIKSGENSIILKTGDKIIGDILKEDQNTITINSKQVGQITINKYDILSVDQNLLNYELQEDEITLNEDELKMLVKNQMRQLLADSPKHYLLTNFGFIPAGAAWWMGGRSEFTVVGSTAALAASVLGISTMLSKYPDNLPYPPEIKTKEDMENYRKLFAKGLKRKFITNILLCNALPVGLMTFIDFYL